MPRQLQRKVGPFDDLKVILKIEEGGTGASTAEQAVENLGGIPRTLLGKPGGVAQADSQGYLSADTLNAAGFKIGYSIEGPITLAHGMTSVFHITNYSDLLIPAVSVSDGSVSINGDEISVTAPLTGTEVILTIGEREITIPVYPAGPVPPLIVHPTEGGLSNHRTIVSLSAFRSEVELYGEWTDISTGTSAIDVTSFMGIEIEGRRGDAGIISISTNEGSFGIGSSLMRRKIFKTNDINFIAVVSGTAELRYRGIIKNATHVSTDWEVATDHLFQNIVASSYSDTKNLLNWAVELLPGAYFVRSRFHAETP